MVERQVYQEDKTLHIPLEQLGETLSAPRGKLVDSRECHLTAARYCHIVQRGEPHTADVATGSAEWLQ